MSHELRIWTQQKLLFTLVTFLFYLMTENRGCALGRLDFRWWSSSGGGWMVGECMGVEVAVAAPLDGRSPPRHCPQGPSHENPRLAAERHDDWEPSGEAKLEQNCPAYNTVWQSWWQAWLGMWLSEAVKMVAVTATLLANAPGERCRGRDSRFRPEGWH
jgi:hypothetical protein